MKAWKKWNADKRKLEWSMRGKSELREIRQLIKKHKKLYSKFRPHKEFRRKYRNRNARERMKKKTLELIVKNVPWLPGKAFWEIARWDS